MKRIGELVAEMCPNGVQFCELDEVARYSDSRIAASSVDESTFVGVDNLRANRAGRTRSVYVPTTGTLTAYQKGDVLIGNIRPYLKKIWLATNAGGCSGDVLAVRIIDEYQHRLTAAFLYSVLSSDAFFAYCMQHARGGKMPRGNKAMILRYRLPIPPIAVQQQIVKVLDAFAELESELEAELEARQRQYRYYSDALLTIAKCAPNATMRWAPVGDLCRVTRGRVISRDYLREHPGSYPVYSSQTENAGIFGYINTFDYDSEFITWTTDGANAGSVFYHYNERFSITNVCGLLRVMKPVELRTKFLYYFLERLAKKHVKAGMGNPKLMSNTISRIQVPLLPIKEQDRIVTILDKIDALVSDLSIGLPAELSARRQQYQYYRDRLLNFRELV